MTDRSPTSEAPCGPLVRRRPKCPACGDFAEWLWRCWCFVGDPPRVCNCETFGVWICLNCTPFGPDINVTEVPV